MRQPLHIIYVTGLGDRKPTMQRRAVWFWRVYGVRPHFFQMNWADGEAWQSKFDRLLELIDELKAQGDVALVGVSAGAAASILAFAERPSDLLGLVLIVAKVNRMDGIQQKYLEQNLAFATVAKDEPAALAALTDKQRQRIMSRYGFDTFVRKADSDVKGAHNRRVFGVTHFWTIAEQDTLGAPNFIRFLKRLQGAKE
jgi:pimeloyl-ACP methyl ester carboxylesterase